MQVIRGSKGGLIKAWVDGVQVEREACHQLDNIAAMPFIYKHVAIMPDVHWGMEATVGSVIPTIGAVIPAAVGVDIGCGMMARRTSLRAEDLPDNLFGIRSVIESRIPHGRTDNGGKNDRGAWTNPAESVIVKFAAHEKNLKDIIDKHPKIKSAAERSINHFGTLGSGNHFVEVCLDEEDYVWIMLHSGSRGIGNRIGSYFIELAKQDMRKWFINLPDIDLAYIPEGTDHFNDYMQAVLWAQDFAQSNREVMMEAAIDAIRSVISKPFHTELLAVQCHHNYVSKEKHFGEDILVTRKGPVSAQLNELGIIPGSMGTRSYIVRGKGNHESFCSCSHGAGRAMSREEAKRRFTLKDHVAATQGVECRKDEGVIDETPLAYKDIDQVMVAQADLVDIIHTLKQVVCVKG